MIWANKSIHSPNQMPLSPGFPLNMGLQSLGRQAEVDEDVQYGPVRPDLQHQHLPLVSAQHSLLSSGAFWLLSNNIKYTGLFILMGILFHKAVYA